MKKKKKNEPDYLPSEQNNRMINYKVYRMKKSEAMIYMLLLFAAGAATGWVFYGNLFMDDGKMTLLSYISNLVVFIIGGIVANVIFLPAINEMKLNKRKEELRIQFRDMLASLAAAFSAGENASRAFLSANEDMQIQYGKDSYIARETAEIASGINNKVSIPPQLLNFAERSGLEDVEDFATVYQICASSGGNLRAKVQYTYDIIGEKMAINEEIETKITSNKMQQKIMSVVPIILIAFLRISSSSFAESFASLKGVAAMTLAGGIFIGSYMYGRKLTDIKG